MKKNITILIISILILTTTSVMAQSIKGIIIKSPIAVEIFVNGQQVSYPAQSIMIVNLPYGTYHIEAYRYLNSRDNAPIKELIFEDYVRFNGRDVKEIFIGDNIENGDIYPPFSQIPIMTPEAFNSLLKELKDAFPDSQFDNILDLQLPYIALTTSQAIEIAKLKSFDNERLPLLKKLFPAIINKENSRQLLNILSFESSQKELSNFIKSYH